MYETFYAQFNFCKYQILTWLTWISFFIRVFFVEVYSMTVERKS